MVGIFKQVLNMSLTASIIILFVVAARLILKKAPKIYSYALWSVVLFRLLCPVSLSFELSVLEVASPQVTQTERISTVTYVPFEPELTENREVLIPETPESIQQAQTQPEEDKVSNPLAWQIAAFAWLAGIVIMVLYSIVTYLRLYRDLVGAMQLKNNIYLADHIQSPFVLGMFRPRIYLPFDTPREERRYIIAHERHHIRRCDHLIKLLAYGALCIHWFNPLVWAAFILAGKDMEMSCDEAVIKKLGEHIRADYSASLLRLATHKKIIAGTPLAFGEGDTKGRVMNMAKWKKPKVWVSILCVVLCIVIVVACAVNPKEQIQMGDGIEFRGLSLRLPEGYFYSHDGKSFNFIDSNEAEVVGGFMICEAPEFALENGEDGVWNAEEWLAALGIPEDEALFSHVISDEPSVDIDGYRLYGDLVAAYTTVPEDIEEKIYYFYLEEENVKIVWFDRRKIEKKTVLSIMDTVEITSYAELDPVEIVMTNGSTTAGFGELYFTLPAGYTMEAVAADAGDYEYMMQISDATNIIGGVVYYDAPDFELISIEDTKDMALWNQDEWIASLGLPDAADETLGHMGGNSLYADYEIEYFTDLPEPVENPVIRQHYFFIWEDAVYDFWFDQTVTDYKTIEKIMKTAAVGQDGPLIAEATPTETEAVAASEEKSINGSIPPGYSIQIGQIPEGYTFEMDEYGNVLFLSGAAIVGGLTSYSIPKGVYDPEDEVFNWLKDVGIPDYEDSSLIYQGGMTFLDNEWSADFASDVPEGTEPSVQRHHKFSVIGDRVFDCWVDLLQVEWDIFMDIRDAVKITDNTEPTETEALYKCHAVLKAVQSGSSHISLERCYYADTFPSDYTQEYLQHQNRDHNEWLSFITVQIAGTAETHANLYADGTYFSNMGKWSEEEILWTEMKTESNPLRPWLTTFQWNGETVAYMDTLSDGSGECVMLRIDEPFVIGTEETEEHYFVNFYYDSRGSFVKVKITVNPYMEEEFSQTESIVTLENLSVYNKINEEYRNATGKSLID